MNKTLKLLVLLGATFAQSAFSRYVAAGGNKVWVNSAAAKATIEVVDQGGLPISGAHIEASIFDSTYSSYRKPLRGLSDANGHYVVEDTTTLDLRFNVSKEGYYESVGSYNFREMAPKNGGAVIDGRWQPWNPTLTVVLREVKNPVPMFAKDVAIKCPVLDIPVGYDLSKGDWVAPYGSGQEADLLFTVGGSLVDMWDREANLKLEFAKNGDGVLASDAVDDGDHSSSKLVSAYSAPDDGYRSSWTFETRFTTNLENRINTHPRENLNFVFRVRTTKDVDGRILSAHYGKIYGDIRCDFMGFEKPPSIGIYFQYYLNPTPNDHNIEFDTNRNLFMNLNPEEKVYRP